MLLKASSRELEPVTMEIHGEKREQHLQQQLQQQQLQQQQQRPLEVAIRRVGIEDHSNIIKLCQVKAVLNLKHR